MLLRRFLAKATKGKQISQPQAFQAGLPWNKNFILRSGANIFVSEILVQGRCVVHSVYYSASWIDIIYRN